MSSDPAFSLPLRWLYVDFNSYFASVEQQLRPALRGKPVAVVAVATDSTCAIAASYEAKAFGIKTGTPIYEARKRCPDLQCVVARHEMYVDFHHRLIQEIEKHVPVTMVCSIDEMACRLMNNENSVAQATALAQRIKRGIAAHVGEYVRCSVGVAPNRYLAKVATDMQKPDGLTFLHAHELPQRLYSLPLRNLPGIGERMEIRLRRAGIADVKTLCTLNAAQVRKAWGSIWGERMWHQLRGVELPDEPTHRSTVGHSHVLPPEYRTPEKARLIARRLTTKAASRLRRMEYDAASLALSVRTEGGMRYALEAVCPPAQDNLTFLHVLEGLWQQIVAEAYGARIKKVSISLNRLTSANLKQMELFSALPDVAAVARQKAERMSRAMDRLNQRFGRDTVSLGILPREGRSFSGTKIAFTRIPQRQEFLE